MIDPTAHFHLADLPAKAARLWPDHVALSWDAGQQRTTYRELEDRASRLATLLAVAGVGPGTRIGMLAPNTPEHFELVFACAHLGAVLVPLNVRLAPREIEFQIGDAGMTHGITHPDLEQLASCKSQGGC